MTTDTLNMNQNIRFPNTPSIDVIVGLKHCNNNHPLYLKILNSFVKRYKNINLHEISAEDLPRTLHSLKGLAATLGMINLSHIVTELEESLDTTKINSFSLEIETIIESILSI